MGKVRGALFSMLEARGLLWPETRVLDVFAGSGSLGFEALSRGAAEALFIESLPKAAALLRENAEKLGLAPQRYHIVNEEAGKALNRPAARPFDLIFIDPPYRRNLLAPTVKAILRRGWLAPEGIINAEVEGGLKFDPAKETPGLAVLADREYGQTRVVLWTRNIECPSSTPALSTR
jgi:16S rRNA (guanine966-N2)-methyltransferase